MLKNHKIVLSLSTGILLFSYTNCGDIQVVSLNSTNINTVFEDININQSIPEEDSISELSLSSDNKIFIAHKNSSNDISISKLNLNGSRDNTFNFNSKIEDGYVNSMISLPQNEVLIGGNFRFNNQNNLIHINSNGTLNSNTQIKSDLNSNIKAILPLRSNEYLVSGLNFSAFKLNSQLTESASTSYSNLINLAYQSDSKILITYPTYPSFNLARLNADLTRDTQFINNFFNQTPHQPSISEVFVHQSGRILVTGDFNSVSNRPSKGVVLLNSDGSLNNSFSTAFSNYSEVRALAFFNDGKIIFAGKKRCCRI